MQQSAKNQAQPAPQVIVVKVKQDHSLLWFILFGWWYVAYRLLKWCVVTSWKLFVAWPVKWTIAATTWSIAASRRFTARYGWRGWAIAAAVVIVLAILGNLTSH